MGNIVLLDDLTINQIAAGEVIERPMNVVKELVENSIDAGATKVIVTIKDGGKTLIQVTDNGSGIDINNMDIALERHATSKISKIEDLENTYSFGFRGEALASISSISELTMISKTADEMVGYKLFSRGGNILEKDEIGASTGTTIKVEKLFYNTPVRYKFLKNDATEFRYIKEFLQKVALAEPDKSIELINNGKQILKTSGNGEIKDVVYLLYGKEIKDNLVDVNYQDGDIKIAGVVGNTFIAEENRKNQILFLNNRNIQDKILTNSADQAFKGSTGIGKYGFFILNLQMPADYYDVNVHPTKKEVRFRDEDKIYKAMYHAIKNAILSKDFLGNTETENNKEDYIENESELVKIASGGEMSRIMLAIKKVIAEADEVPVMIFDEIDTGISGKAANAVADKMKSISKNHQVLCISHLAAIAASANYNYFISKKVENERTATKVKLLNEKEVLCEIARISSGEVNEVTLQYANELRKKVS